MYLSVIIAAYNAKEYIGRCIDSVLSDNEDVEIVVVNDASTDGTKEALENYRGKIKIINLEKNCGCIAKTRNIGLKNAAGDYVTYLDADDYYRPGAVKKIIECVKNFKCDILRYGYVLTYPDGESKSAQNPIAQNKFVTKDLFKEHVYKKFIKGIELNSVCLAVFKRKILENLWFSEKFHTAEDAAFSLEAYTRAENVMFLKDELYCYYQTKTGLTGSGTAVFEKYKYNFLLSAKMLRFLKTWQMNSLKWQILVILRPLRLTVDKLKRS